jgi:group I intron endonuclease
VSDASQSIAPVKIYENADTMKRQMSLENKGKSGIYRWINTLNGKTYIGSSVNISRRLKDYYSLSYLEKSEMAICLALLKYGYSNFSFEILEYCDKSVLIEREQYYFNLFEPQYNILKIAGSRFGLNHSEETRKKISEALSGRLRPDATKQKISEAMIGRIICEETRKKISEARKGDKNPMYGISNGTTIYVYSLDFQLLYTFTSANKARLYFKCSGITILKYALSRQIFRGEYIFSLEVIETSSKSA